MNITFLAWRDLSHPQAGGSEVLIDRIARGLVARHHEVTLVCGGPVAPREYDVIEAGGRFTQYIRAPAKTVRHCHDADLVVDVANGMSYMSPIWRRKPSVCFVNHVHADQWAQWFSTPVASLGRLLETQVTPLMYRRRLFVAVSPSTARALEKIGVDPDQIRIVPNGVDPVTFSGTKSLEPLFVSVGRLVPHKRFDLLLPIWDRVRQHTGGRLVIIGDGPEEERLRAMAGPGVDFAGHVSDAVKQRLVAEAWLLLHPSMLEGWGLVITEAAAAGTTALAFDVPGVRDSVINGDSGVLVGTQLEFAAEWVALTHDRHRRARLEEGARRRAAQLTGDATVERFLEVADEAIALGGRRVRVPARARAIVPSLVPIGPAPEVSIIVPAFNEASRLRDALPAISSAARSLDSELIFVDDGSTDGTSDIARELLRDARRPVLLRHDVNLGKGAAVRTGVAEARGSKVVFMDADLATDLEHLPEVLAALDTAHLAIGSRAARGATTTGASRGRAYMGRGFNHWARALTGAPIADFQCGFKAFRSPAAKVLFDLCQVDGFAFDVEILALAHRFGYRTVEIPVRWHAVSGGHVRPVRDAPRMGLSVVRSQLRWTRQRALTAIRAYNISLRDPEVAAHALFDHLGAPTAIVRWGDGALGLLPFVDPTSASRVAVRLQEEMPDFAVQSAQLAARELLAASGRAMRSAIAAA